MNNSVNLGYMDISQYNLRAMLKNIFQNQFLEIQCLLSELNNYANKINRIIVQINSIMTKIDLSVNSEFNDRLNKINNYMSMMDIMDIKPLDYNIKHYYSLPNILNDGINYNICFKDESGNKIVINSFNKNRTINELINFYLIKKGEHFLVDNYDSFYNFRFGGKLLNNRKNMLFKDSGLFDNCLIFVSDRKYNH